MFSSSSSYLASSGQLSPDGRVSKPVRRRVSKIAHLLYGIKPCHERKVEDGDIVNVDVTVYYKGVHERVMKYEADDSGTVKIEKKNEQMRREVILRGGLSMTVVSAEGLPALDFLGKSDPYMVLHDTLNPVWNQTFDFVVDDALHELLILEVYDHDTIGKRVSNLIGGKFVDSHSSEEIDVVNLISYF
ncbi:hypothetical protein Droror1_Dr00022187 [Drosera rotundifolia]